MCPLIPSTVGENMDHSVTLYGPNVEFNPREMLTPPKYAMWLVKYSKLVVLAISNRQYGEQRFGQWGFPSVELQTRLDFPGEIGGLMPSPYPPGM